MQRFAGRTVPVIWRWFKREPLMLAREYFAKHDFELLGENVTFAAGQVDFVVKRDGAIMLVKVRARGVTFGQNSKDPEADAECVARLFAECRDRYGLGFETVLRYDVLRLDWYGRSSKPVLRYFPGAVVPAEPAIAQG